MSARHALFALILVVFATFAARPATASEEVAISHGTTACGKLTGGVALPCSGDNFEAYHWMGCALGRNYVHPLVRDVLLDAYDGLKTQYPDQKWEYGETGFEEGGRFKPHRTHQNGTSVDFFFPVLGKDGKPALNPIGILNKFGYDLDFSSEGTLGDLRIHWKALADHILALEAAGKKHQVKPVKIILAPVLQKKLLGADPRMARFAEIANKKPAWVLHDEHYHIDFELPEKYRRAMRCE